MGEPLQMLLTWLLSFSGYGQANKARTRKEALVQGRTNSQSWSGVGDVDGVGETGRQEGRMGRGSRSLASCMWTWDVTKL